jgi:hypothetical protein
MTQLAGGEPLSPKYLTRNTSTAFLFGLRNATRTIDRLTARRMHPSFVNDEFVGMADYITESFHDLLMRDSEVTSNSDSSGRSHHPSHECFMADTPDGHVESVQDEGATPLANIDDEVEGYARVLPRLRIEQLRVWQKELEDARLQLEQEHTKLKREIERRENSGRARAIARDMNRRIIEDDEDLPHFARASQNIATAVALLQGLSEPATPKDRRAHRKIRTLLEHATVQQAESSLSR